MTQFTFPTPNAWKAISVAPGHAASSGNREEFCEFAFHTESIARMSEGENTTLNPLVSPEWYN